MNKECKVEVVSGILDHFIVEPFVPHKQSDEYYICIQVILSVKRRCTFSDYHHNLVIVIELSRQRRGSVLS